MTAAPRGIKLHLRTRGTSVDYGFLGEGPADRWSERFLPWSRFEDPTVVVERTAGRTASRRFLVAGFRRACGVTAPPR